MTRENTGHFMFPLSPAVTAKVAVRTVGSLLREHMTLVLITENNHNGKHRKDSRGPGLHVTLPPSTYVCDPQQSLRRGHWQERGLGSLRLSEGRAGSHAVVRLPAQHRLLTPCVLHNSSPM